MLKMQAPVSKCFPVFLYCFELALGLNLYPLIVEVLISDRESDFCHT